MDILGFGSLTTTKRRLDYFDYVYPTVQLRSVFYSRRSSAATLATAASLVYEVYRSDVYVVGALSIVLLVVLSRLSVAPQQDLLSVLKGLGRRCFCPHTSVGEEWRQSKPRQRAIVVFLGETEDLYLCLPSRAQRHT